MPGLRGNEVGLDYMLGEVLQAAAVVEDDVGVENEQLRRSGSGHGVLPAIVCARARAGGSRSQTSVADILQSVPASPDVQ